MKQFNVPNIIRAIALFIIMISFFSTAHAVHAATLTLDPVTASSPIGGTFDVKIMIDTENENVTSTDIVLQFNSTIMTVSNIINGGTGIPPFFPDFFQNVSGNEIYIGAAVLEPTDSKTGTGTLATITLQGASEGISDLIFDCTAGKTSDTNISKNDKNATDIVNCAVLVKGQYSIGSGINPTAAPNPTATIAPTLPVGAPTATPTLTPKGTPKGGPISTPSATPTTIRISLTPGSVETTVAIIGVGALLLIGGLGSNIVMRYIKYYE